MDLDCSDEALHLCFHEQRSKFLFWNPVVPAAIGFAVVALHFVSVPPLEEPLVFFIGEVLIKFYGV